MTEVDIVGISSLKLLCQSRSPEGEKAAQNKTPGWALMMPSPFQVQRATLEPGPSFGSTAYERSALQYKADAPNCAPDSCPPHYLVFAALVTELSNHLTELRCPWDVQSVSTPPKSST